MWKAPWQNESNRLGGEVLGGVGLKEAEDETRCSRSQQSLKCFLRTVAFWWIGLL